MDTFKEKELQLADDNSELSIEIPETALPFNGPDLDLASLTTEQQAEAALLHVIYNAENQYTSLIDQLSQTSEWISLSSMEKNDILNMNPQQKVLLSIIVEANRSDVDWTRLKHCGLAALGFHRAQNLLINAFKTGMTAQTAIQALRFIGQKYLGYIALAFAIYEFTTCIIDENPDEEHPLIGERENIFELPTNEPGFCPDDVHSSNYWDFSTKYFSIITLENLTQNNLDATPNIRIYLNPDNYLLYSDSAYSELLPNGYYYMKCRSSLLFYEFTKVVDGVATMVYGKYL